MIINRFISKHLQRSKPVARKKQLSAFVLMQSVPSHHCGFVSLLFLMNLHDSIRLPTS